MRALAPLLALLAALPALAASAQVDTDGWFTSPAKIEQRGGQEIYAAVCAGCHMAEGEGAVGAGTYPALAGNETLTGADYPIHVVLNGLKDMPSFARELDDTQIAEVVTYVRTSFGNAYEDDPATAQHVAAARAITQPSTNEAAPPPEPTTATDGTDQREEPEMKKLKAMGAGAAAAALVSLSAQAEVIRHPIPNSDFPILRAVEVPGDATVVYLSGMVPGKKVEDGDPADIATYGTMEEQTVSVLKRIDATLQSLDLKMGDVFKMQAFLVAEEGKLVDFSGFMAGYSQFFGTEAQPNLPTRSAMVVDALARPGFLVELEVTAVRP